MNSILDTNNNINNNPPSLINSTTNAITNPLTTTTNTPLPPITSASSKTNENSGNGGNGGMTGVSGTTTTTTATETRTGTGAGAGTATANTAAESQKMKKSLNEFQKFSIAELMISENDRSPCYIQRQRIKTVLNELYKKVIIVGLLPDVIERHFVNIFDPEITALVKKYLDIKSEYLVVRKSDGGEINQLYLNEVIKKYKVAVRNVYRAFIFSPESYLRLLKYQEDHHLEKVVEVMKFERAIKEFLHFLYDKLDMTYEQDQKKQKEIKEITEIEQKKKEKVENFKTILKNAINERYENISEKTRQMEEYKDELEKCKLTSENNIKRIKATSKQIIEREKKQSMDKKKQISAEISILEDKLEEMEEQNKEEENAHLKKKFRIESEIENWIHKYDDEVSRKQEEFDMLTRKYNDQHKELIELQERYEKLKEEYKQEKEERELLRKAEEVNKKRIIKKKKKIFFLL